jgi:hypothetical protein
MQDDRMRMDKLRYVAYELLTWIAKCLACRNGRFSRQNMSRVADMTKFMLDGDFSHTSFSIWSVSCVKVEAMFPLRALSEDLCDYM